MLKLTEITATRMAVIAGVAAVAVLAVAGCGSGYKTPAATQTANGKNRTIIFVWDGLRPDSVTQADTPNLFKLRQGGVSFSDNHAAYPTFTMINGAAFATGDYAGKTGFNGNNVYAPTATGKSANGSTVNFTNPTFTEDWGILDDLNAYYQASFQQPLLNAQTLFAAAQGTGLSTAAVGKSGPAYLQDYKRGGTIIDENTVWPLTAVKEMQGFGFALPANTPFMYPAGAVTLSASNGTPTAGGSFVTFADGQTPDPTDNGSGRFISQNTTLTNYFTGYVMFRHLPDLSLFWLRTVDATQHDYGVGSTNYHASLQANDQFLGQIEGMLALLGQTKTTNIIIVSDHGHSNVTGPTALFPLRGVVIDPVTGKNTVGAVSTNGYSVSGYVRAADLLTRAGFHAYDGNGCDYSPVLSGIRADGTNVYPTLVDTTGAICGTANAKYTSPAYPVPAALPADAVIAVAPGGSDQFYLPSHDPALMQRLVTFLQSREEYGAMFLDARYGSLAGTLPAAAVNLQNAAQRNPDLTVSFNWDDQATLGGMPGFTFDSATRVRGMHGSFSPIDIHNTLIANGPDFKSGYTDPLPTGNVDVAPTVAFLLGLSLPNTDGRPLLEALKTGGTADSSYQVAPAGVTSTAVSGLKFQLPTDRTGAAIDTALTGLYTGTVMIKQLKDANGKTYSYFDYAKVIRQ